jgi:hypothetical protein
MRVGGNVFHNAGHGEGFAVLYPQDLAERGAFSEIFLATLWVNTMLLGATSAVSGLPTSNFQLNRSKAVESINGRLSSSKLFSPY